MMRAFRSHTRIASRIALAATVIAASACTTDDVTVEPPDTRNLYPLEDDAFGEYLAYLAVPGIVENDAGEATRYSLDLDRLDTVTELSLPKTNGVVETLTQAGLTTAADKITSLDGLQYFTNLQVLRITSNSVRTLDVSALTALTTLEMNFNQVGTLDLRSNAALATLRYEASSSASDGGRLTRVDLSGNPDLRHLSLPGHDLVAIDLRSNPRIDEVLDLSENPGPDGDRETGDIVVPAAIYDQVPEAMRLGVVSDADAPVQLSLTADATALPEAGSGTTLRAVLNRTSTEAVSLELVTAGSATLDVDYALSATSLVIAAGETEATVELSMIDDGDTEGRETIEVRATNVVGAQAASVIVDLTIEDDEGMVDLVINEVLYDPPNDEPGDANGDGARDANEDEFVEIVNVGTTAIDISGYLIFDTDALDMGMPRHTVDAGTVLQPNQAFVLFGGGAPAGDFGGAIVQVCNGFEARLNLTNAGDVLTVQTGGGNTVLEFDIEPLSNNPDESYTRAPDLTGDFEQHGRVVDGVLFSPGTRADGSSF